MQSEVHFDERGRITLPRALREGLGDRVVAIRTPHGVLLRPVPDTLPSHALPPALQASGEDAGLEEAGR